MKAIMIISIDIVAVLSLSLHSSIHTSVSPICMNGDSETFKCGCHTHRQRKREKEYAHIPSKRQIFQMNLPNTVRLTRKFNRFVLRQFEN